MAQFYLYIGYVTRVVHSTILKLNLFFIFPIYINNSINSFKTVLNRITLKRKIKNELILWIHDRGNYLLVEPQIKCCFFYHYLVGIQIK